MKILFAKQIRELDASTISNEPIESIDLMERASLTFVLWFVEKFKNTEQDICIFCSTGNNGGDGLAIARLLHQRFYPVQIFLCQISDTISKDFATNFDRLPKRDAVPLQSLKKGVGFPNIPKNAIIIDAILGTGLDRSLEVYWSDLFMYLNKSENTIASVDIPSGVFSDQHTKETSIQADYTFSFELPKLAFMFPENQNKIGQWNYRSIGLHPSFIKNEKSSYHYVDINFVKTLLKTRNKFDHKGTFGHALLIAGSYGKVGAAVLAAKACLRSGAGKLTVHIPKCAYQILQISVPEAMLHIDFHENILTEIGDLEDYNAIGIGCGLGTETMTSESLEELLKKTKIPLVLDADALNILAKNKKLLNQIPANSILTPHPKEFERLFGTSKNDFERNEKQRTAAMEYNIYIILKGAHTCTITPKGDCYFNSTGNPGMATAGSGDVLTGVITALIAQNYDPLAACTLSVYLHGLAGDLALQKNNSMQSLIASDIIDHLGAAFKMLYN